MLLREAEAVDRDRPGRGEQAQHHVLEAAVGGNGGHAQLDLVLRRELGEVDLAVLGLAPLGDVEVAHDLDPGDQRVAVVRRQLEVGAQRPVLAEAHPDLLLAGVALEVDVGDVVPVRLDDHVVEQAHQRVVALLDRLFLVGGGGAALPAFLLERFDELVGGARQRRQVVLDRRQVVGLPAGHGAADLLVGGAQRGLDREAPGEHRQDLHVGVELDLVERGAARRVVEGDHEAAVADQERHHPQARGDAVVELAQRLGLGREGVEVDERVAHLARERGLQVAARDDAHAHQDLAERNAAVELLLTSASWSWSSVTMPSDISASPMRTSGRIHELERRWTAAKEWQT